MDIITPDVLDYFVNNELNYCVSITLEASPIVSSDIENPIKLKNVLNEVREKLRATELSATEVEAYLREAYLLVDDTGFWRDQFSGLLLYITSEKFFKYKLPYKLEDNYYLSRNCHILPLLQYISENGKYNLLHLDEGGSKLYESDRYQITEIHIPVLDMTTSKLMEKYQIEEESFFHVEREGGRAKSQEGVVFHGHGNAKDNKKIRLRQLLNMISRELTPYFENNKLPIVLIGHDDIVSEFINLVKTDQTLIKGIRRDIKMVNEKKLLKEGWKSVEPHFRNLRTEKLENYRNKMGSGLTSSDIADLIKNSREGRVENLFLETDLNVFGRVIQINEDVKIEVTNNPIDENLTNILALHTLKNGGEVNFFSKKTMPEPKHCAILRY